MIDTNIQISSLSISFHVMPLLLEFRVTFSSWVPLFSPNLSIFFWLLLTHNNQVTDHSNCTWLFCIHRQMKAAGSRGTTMKMDPYKVMSTTGRIFVFINLSFDLTQQFRPFSSEITPKYSSFLLRSLYLTTQATIRYTLKRTHFGCICTYMFLYR